MEMHKGIYTSVSFFKEKPMTFIAWIAPMLIQIEFQKDQYVFLEGENVNYVFFIMKGESGFVLPRYDNSIYILVCQGDHFGLIDMISKKAKQMQNVAKKEGQTWNQKR